MIADQEAPAMHTGQCNQLRREAPVVLPHAAPAARVSTRRGLRRPPPAITSRRRPGPPAGAKELWRWLQRRGDRLTTWLCLGTAAIVAALIPGRAIVAAAARGMGW